MYKNQREYIYILQYCGKVMRANFDEIRPLFFRIFIEIPLNFRSKVHAVQATIQRHFNETSLGHAIFRKANRNIEERNFEQAKSRRKEFSSKRNIREITLNTQLNIGECSG